MKRLRTALIMAAVLALLSGCETLEKSWDSTWGTTKEYYKEYVNPDPVIDYEARDWTSSEEKLAQLFTPVDDPVNRLAVFLNREDRFPEDAWVDKLTQEFPWISGLAVATMDGEIVLQRPETALKPLNLAPALAKGAELADRRLRSYVDMTPLGPEVYLYTGMFSGNDVSGIIAVHFDARRVLDFCPAPGELMIVTQDAVVWPGDDAALAASIQSRPWAETLTEEIQGRIDEGGAEYLWLTRYLGDTQLLYVTRALEDEQEQDDSWFSLFGLF